MTVSLSGPSGQPPSKPTSAARSALPTGANADAGTTTDLTQPAARAALAKRLKHDIDAWCVQKFDDGPRAHLGASVIGRECARELWYGFRWAHYKRHDGRMLRLFQRGHLEEGRIIEYLEGIGATVEYVDTDAAMTLLYRAEGHEPTYAWRETSKRGDITGWLDVTDSDAHREVAEGLDIYPEYPQFRIEGCGGHFGGSMDGKLILPEKYNVGPVVFCAEFKTYATKPFSDLSRDGVQVKKYEHFCQMSTYGRKLGLQYGAYIGANKNDDDLHIEIVRLDWDLGARLEAKADRIIQSPTPPQKLSESATFKTCAYCDMRPVCHENEPYQRNCRSCEKAQPVDNKQWFCHHWQSIIPVDAIPKGCDSWKPAR